MHGYDLQSDLARFYRFTDVVLLSLLGELPSDEVSRAFEVALVFASAACVAEAPSHAAVVARVCGPRASSVAGVAGLALAEQARALLDRYDPLLPKLAIGALNGSASRLAPVSAEDRAAVERLRVALGGFTSRVPSLGYDVCLDAALVATFMACGIRGRETLELAFIFAKLMTVCAEALTWKPGDLRSYPMDLPHFVYEGAKHA